MKTYRLNFGWEIDFPDDWIHEVDENGVNVFYPPDDSTTAYATEFSAGRDGTPAPAKVLMDFFVKSLDGENAEEIPFSVANLGGRAFCCVSDRGVYRIAAGVFTAGNLLSLNVYSESEDMVRKAVEWFSGVRLRTGLPANGFACEQVRL